VSKILTENAENLMKIVLQTMKAAESVCVKVWSYLPLTTIKGKMLRLIS